ncbi:double-strand break repair helicase AddA [Puniceibacterium sediminis]|uniref:DNA 3'-5' helicase n=1 Tax=Puniceibacterium sediminis TaxID=1608407 RepID=A0A238VQX4_9RHOB|nr:double-strand break repair helicase AddA [Puniceibacterium sediminis]SNR36581.1 DNA helicase/exodeoxyribonuclease V, subunit A [Puniceibacterium sediminis]
MIRDDASARQVQAASPDLSTWLSANAGSGKTRVLTDRVARLLLGDVLPEHILCLTYTKAAATEMQNRLFRRLGAWAMLPDDKLRDELGLLGVDTGVSGDFLQKARTLFARAIETPGGLRIQTIHSFCAALLRRFPLEARVSPQFKEMEDRAADLLRTDILDRFSDGPQAHLVAALAQYLTNDEPEALLRDIVRKPDAFLPPRDDATIHALYGLKPDANMRQLLASTFLGSEVDLITSLIPLLKASGSNDQKAAAILSAFDQPDEDGLTILTKALLTQTGTLRKNFPAKAVRTANPDLTARLDELALRVEDARNIQLALRAARRDIVLHRFAQAFLPAYAAEKQRRGWLDFDDLIDKARALLSDPRVAQWVLYRLDGGIDHILVDEAQDTSPAQWQVIERLAQEFTSGDGARADVNRTIFVVGDKKQSIYSFQGADPREFDRMRDDFAARLEKTGSPLNDLTLDHSFRSAEPILRLVDNTFVGSEASGFSAAQGHVAFKEKMPGRVDLWPHVPKTEEDKDGDWHDPVDQVGQRHHTVILAQRIARFMRETIDAGTPLPTEIGHSGTYETRPVHAGDFLILVRGRSRLFTEIIRACKQEGLPIAGADRLKVMAELAVRDLGALLSFLATPEDDLSLATALRSPLFRLSENQLFGLAQGRKGYLWTALRERAQDFPQVMDTLGDLMAQTDFLRPFDLIERILTRHRGRKRLLGRLGDEAEDGINALLQQALAYEQNSVPSLTGFLTWMQTDDLTIKRAADSAGGRVRVMTVHGAKGLEAPIVILPDCAQPQTALRDALLNQDDTVLWKQASTLMPPAQTAAQEIAKEAQSRERDRLLYVAMTRAEKWLIVAAAGELGKNGESWYDRVKQGLDRSGAVPQTYGFGDLGTGEGLQLGVTDLSGLTFTNPDVRHEVIPELPEHFLQTAPIPVPPPEVRTPSDLGGAKALPGPDGDDSEVAKARGERMHKLLEHLALLPATERAGMAERWAGEDPDQDTLSLVEESLALMAPPALSHLFAPGSLAEVPLTADVPPLGRLHGIIDRLIVTSEKITAVDFKTNRTVPDNAAACPEGLLRQMGAYLAMLGALYPDRDIEVGLLWTRTAHYMPLPHALVTQAIRRAGTP